jgi:hypothetical protein
MQLPLYRKGKNKANRTVRVSSGPVGTLAFSIAYWCAHVPPSGQKAEACTCEKPWL